MGVLGLARDEEGRLVGWSILLVAAVAGWNLFLWRMSVISEPDTAPDWLLPAILATPAALGALGGVVVPRRRASLLSLLTECGVGAGAVGAACFFAFITINSATGEPDHPFALGLGAGLVAVASFVVLTPAFGCAYALRELLVRLATSARAPG